MKNVVKRALRQFGIRVSRSPGNRFEVIGDTLAAMRGRGFEPRIVIDGGANCGQFFSLARPIFPDAVFHLIEPQPVCTAALRTLAKQDGGDVVVHETALTKPGVQRVRMVGGGDDGGGVGNWVANADDHAPGEFEAQATTLDSLLDEGISIGDRGLLKLDLEHHELPALEGATALLAKVEAILIEVTFFDINDWGATLFPEVVDFLGGRGFVLYDFASLASRARDGRLRMGDAMFVRNGTPLVGDNAWS
jgi:FkbM family methyltransferase